MLGELLAVQAQLGFEPGVQVGVGRALGLGSDGQRQIDRFGEDFQVAQEACVSYLEAARPEIDPAAEQERLEADYRPVAEAKQQIKQLRAQIAELQQREAAARKEKNR